MPSRARLDRTAWLRFALCSPSCAPRCGQTDRGMTCSEAQHSSAGRIHPSTPARFARRRHCGRSRSRRSGRGACARRPRRPARGWTSRAGEPPRRRERTHARTGGHRPAVARADPTGERWSPHRERGALRHPTRTDRGTTTTFGRPFALRARGTRAGTRRVGRTCARSTLDDAQPSAGGTSCRRCAAHRARRTPVSRDSNAPAPRRSSRRFALRRLRIAAISRWSHHCRMRPAPRLAVQEQPRC